MPFAIEIPLPLETSDLNPSGICAADCRLIRMVVLLEAGPRCTGPVSLLLLPPFSPLRISLLLFHYSPFLPRSRRMAGRCRNSPGPFLAANVTLLRSAKQTAAGR